MALQDSRRFVTLERIVKNGFINFGRNVWLAIAAIAMMGITLTILLFAIVANVTLRHEINDLKSHIDVSIFLKDKVSDKQTTDLVQNLQKIDEVKSVDYISKVEALKTYREQNANNPELLAAISEIDNPLPAKLVIHPKDAYKMQTIKSFINKPQNK